MGTFSLVAGKNTLIFGPIGKNEKSPEWLRVPSRNLKLRMIVWDVSSPGNICLYLESQKGGGGWIIYFGATLYTCHNKDLFSILEKVQLSSISVGDKSSVQISGRRAACLRLSVFGNWVSCNLKNVLYASSMGYNMISDSVVRRYGITSFEDRYPITKHDLQLAKGVSKHNLHLLSTGAEISNAKSSTLALVADLKLWHQMHAHVYPHFIHDIVCHGVVEGIKLDKMAIVTCCKGCVFEKSTRASVPSTKGCRSKNVLELFHTKVFRKILVPSLEGSNYFIQLLTTSLDMLGYIPSVTRIKCMKYSISEEPRCGKLTVKKWNHLSVTLEVNKSQTRWKAT